MIVDGPYTGHATDWWPDTSKAGNSMMVILFYVDGQIVQGEEAASPYEGTELRYYCNLTPKSAEISMEVLRMLGWSGKTFKSLRRPTPERPNPDADTLDTKIGMRVRTDPSESKYPRIDSIWEFGVNEPRQRTARADPESVTNALDRDLGVLLVDAPDMPGPSAPQPPTQLDEPDGDIPF